MAEKNNKDINTSDSKNTYDPDNCNSDDDLSEDEESEYSDLSVVPLDESDEVSDDIDDSKIIEENKAQVTAAQANFIKMMPFVRAFEMARKEGTLSEEDKRMRDALLYKLWSEVAFYARGLITAGMDTYIKDNDYRLDLEQDCRLIFYENLMNYNPEISAPTTYFKRYFLQKISEYKHKNSQHMTANEAKNIYYTISENIVTLFIIERHTVQNVKFSIIVIFLYKDTPVKEVLISIILIHKAQPPPESLRI